MSNSSFKNPPEVLECTIRDGSYAAVFSEVEVSSIVSGLDLAGFRLIEVGNGLGLGCYRSSSANFPMDDVTGIRAAINARTSAKIGVFFIPGVGTDDDLRRAADLGVDFVRIGQTPRSWRRAIESIELAKELGMTAYFNCMKSYLCNRFEFLVHARAVAELEVEGIYLVDSAGGMTPREVGLYVELLSENLGCAIGFHGHNNLGLANANNLAALECGASLVDTTLGGLGRGGGNAATEAMVLILQKLGYLNSVDTETLLQLKDEFVKDRKESLVPTVVDVVSGFAMFHSGFLEMFTEIAQRHSVKLESLIIEVSRIDRENPSVELVTRIAEELCGSKVDPYRVGINQRDFVS
jgi:4-hydroxy 2-oxovalerate aldolase